MAIHWHSLPEYGIPPEEMPEHFRTPDLATARQLLEAAGHGDGVTLERHESTVGLTPTKDSEVLREQWGKIGVTLNIVTHAPGSYQAQRDGFPGHFFGDGWTPYPDPDFYIDWFRSATSERTFKPQWPDPTLDEMADKARIETEVEARQEQYREIQMYMDETVPQYSLYDREWNEVVSKRLVGYSRHAQGIVHEGIFNTSLA